MMKHSAANNAQCVQYTKDEDAGLPDAVMPKSMRIINSIFPGTNQTPNAVLWGHEGTEEFAREGFFML